MQRPTARPVTPHCGFWLDFAGHQLCGNQSLQNAVIFTEFLLENCIPLICGIINREVIWLSSSQKKLFDT
jgi:hypothetical protein